MAHDDKENAMEKIDALRADLEQHKADTKQQFKEVKLDLDNRINSLYEKVQRLHGNSVQKPDEEARPDLELNATPNSRYHTKQTKSAIFLATNAFNFNGPGDAYLKMEARGRNLHIKAKRPVRTPEEHQQSKYGTSMFPCAVIGSLNGRECSWMDTDKVDRLSGKRQYDYPVHDLQQVHELVGLPGTIKSIRSCSLSTAIRGNMKAANGFLDMYLHDEKLTNLEYTGYNALNGNYTKGLNINTWFMHPEEYNVPGLANGWTGATKIADKHISGMNCEVAVKVERVNGNEFLYFAVAPESRRVVKWDVRTVLDFALEDLWRTIQESPAALALIATMERKPTAPHDLLKLCGLHLGAEIWHTEDREEELVFEDLQFEINGVVHTLEGISNDLGKPRIPKKKPNGGSRVRTERLVFTRTGQRKSLPNSKGGGRITHLSKQGLIDTQETRDWPNISIMPMGYGKLDVQWTDKAGADWVTEIVIQQGS